MPDKIVVTGLGGVSSLGDVDDLWSALKLGRSGIGPLTAFDAAPYRTKVAGEARAFDPLEFLSARDVAVSSRYLQLAIAAASRAVINAALELDREDPGRIGVYLGTSMGSLGLALAQSAIFETKGIDRVHPMAPTQNYAGVAASEIAIRLGITGPTMTISTACTSGADAIGFALSQLRAGVVDVALAGSSEAPLFPFLFSSFDRLGLMSRQPGDPERACRPFSRERDGIVLSEGAIVCVLETERHARARQASICAELAGFAATSDAHHQLQQLPSGDEAARAIALALADARVDARDVDYICAHGTGTQANDRIETVAIKRTFGARAFQLPVSSIKSMTGHLMGACGALEFAASVKAVVAGVIPPTINLDNPDPECDLDYVPNEARIAPLQVVVSNTFGFGSRNAVLVVKRMT